LMEQLIGKPDNGMVNDVLLSSRRWRDSIRTCARRPGVTTTLTARVPEMKRGSRNAGDENAR
jgi:hypothetical protein